MIFRRNHHRHQKGVSLTSYGLLVGLISIVALAAITSIGDSTEELFTGVASTIDGDAVFGVGGTGGSPTPMPSPLFSFTSHTFSACGAAGRLGPSQTDCRASYNTSSQGDWDEDDGFFTVSGGIQLWTVPVSGSYRLTAEGAQGGSTPTRDGGRGATMQGDFELVQGQQLKILVGQMGLVSCSTEAGGGGGGSFITLADNTPLLVAGGGGGAAWQDENGQPGLTTENAGRAGAAQAGPLGGTSGNGGAVSNGNVHNSASGAGFFGDGALPSPSDEIITVARSFTNGGAGGENSRTPDSNAAHGGFGGGGAGDACSVGGGGGGGYSGGGGGRHSSDPGSANREGGGGGGSFNAGTNQNNIAGGNANGGTVNIQLL